MTIERIQGSRCSDPFPIYENLVGDLLTAHAQPDAGRDAIVAHTLGICAGYAYSDIETVSMMMTRLGLESHACVRISQTVDAMLIFSTAYIVQSPCGRVAILCYRGTEPAVLGNWLGDADVGTESSTMPIDDGAQSLRVHDGIRRNVRATQWAVTRELGLAIQGKSLFNPDEDVAHPLEALYIAGHSLGGAMALLFGLTVAGNSSHRAIFDRLRAVYTFGQPMAIGGPLPAAADAIGRKLIRHVMQRDPVPSLPPSQWGALTHIGQEYRLVDGEWQRSDIPVAQLANIRQIPGSVLGFFAPTARRASFRYMIAEHAPHHYLAALRPKGRPTEFGDWG